MNKKDIVIYTKEILSMIINRKYPFSKETWNTITKYFAESKEISEPKNIDFLLISTAFLVNEGLVPDEELESICRESYHDEIERVIEDDIFGKLLTLNTPDGREIIAEMYYETPSTVSSSNEEGEYVDERPNPVGYIISRLENYYEEELFGIVDPEDEDLFSLFIKEYEEYFRLGEKTPDKESKLLELNDEFIDKYNVNLFELIKDFLIDYPEDISLNEVLLSNFKFKKIDSLTKHETKQINEELKQSLKDNSAIYITRENRIDLDPVKLIILTRNALAHNNYEILNNNKIRLYRVISENGVERTIFNVVMDLKLVKIISNSVENACFNAYRKAYFDRKPISLNLIYDEEFNHTPNHETQNETYTGDMYLYQKQEKELILKFLITCILNANIMALHNIDLNQVENKLNFESFILDKKTKDSFITLLKKSVTRNIDSIIKARTEASSNESDSLAKTVREELLKYLNGEENRLSSYLSKDAMKLLEETPYNGSSLIDYLEKIEAELTSKEEAQHKQYKFANKSLTKSKKFISKILDIEREIHNHMLEDQERQKLESLDSSDYSSLFKGEEFTKFILRNVRTALAHGWIEFVYNEPIDKSIIIFQTYSKEDRTQEFCGAITVKELFETILSKDHLDEMIEQSSDQIKK